MTRLAGKAAVAFTAVALAGCTGTSSSAAPAPVSASSRPSTVVAGQHHKVHQVQDPFSRRIERELVHHRRTMSAAALRLSNAHSVVRNPKVSVYTASILKVAILMAAEQRARRGGHGLTAAQRVTAQPMIEASDNDAATTLWREAGKAPALFSLFRELGMTHTRRAPTLFEPWDGVTTTTADQLRLLQALANGTRSLTAGDRRYALGLMRHVEPDQDWGVPTGTKPRWSVAVKNGWVPVGTNGWTVNTIGIVRPTQASAYAVAIVTTGSRSEAAGIRKVDAIARSVAHRWG